MKADIHPDYHQATVTCHCGNTFTVGSTIPEIKVEICSKCHPFYTGQQKAARADGRIEKFNKKYAAKNAKN
ncbi:MAG: 50S ribosomal protein L31 [Lachnospiraceae bacterium]|nr:50S ribosomal protein L31 [Lachnospiraceae bacterium]